MTESEQMIIDIVNVKNGCKSTELVVEFVKRMTERNNFKDAVEFNETLEKLILEKALIEVKYVLPTMAYREKSFILPAETKIEIQSIP